MPKACGMLLISLAICLPFILFAQVQPPAARWDFGPLPDNALNVEYTEVATYVVKTGVGFQLCWGNPNSNAAGEEETALQLAYRRYRVEGGPTETSEVVQYPQWKPQKDAEGNVIPRTYCANVVGLPKAGHWVFSAQMCRVPYVSDAESCSGWMESVTKYTPEGGGGTVDEKPRGWWMYAYLPAPGGVGVD